MIAAANLDWLYHVLGWTLAAAGVALLVWALFWDRSRGRRRCPKCWYSMEGVPGLRCPECGREARSERALFKSRRRWCTASAAVLVVLSGYAAPCVPAIHAQGFRAFIPTNAMILGLDWMPDSVVGSSAMKYKFDLAGTLADRLRSPSAWQRRRVETWCRSTMDRARTERIDRAIILLDILGHNFHEYFDDAAMPKLIDGLVGGTPVERRRCAGVLIRVSYLGSTDRQRAHILEGLGPIGQAISDSDDEVSRAGCLLATIANGDLVRLLPNLVTAVNERQQHVRNMAAGVIQLQADKHEAACRAAENVINSGPPEAKSSMLRALSGAVEYGVATADKQLAAAVRRALDDSDDAVAGAAAMAWLHLRPEPKSAEEVIDSMDNGRTQYWWFLEAWQGFGPIEGYKGRLMPHLIRALELNPNLSTQQVVYLLRRFGADAAAALPALKAVVENATASESAKATARKGIIMIEQGTQPRIPRGLGRDR